VHAALAARASDLADSRIPAPSRDIATRPKSRPRRRSVPRTCCDFHPLPLPLPREIIIPQKSGKTCSARTSGRASLSLAALRQLHSHRGSVGTRRALEADREPLKFSPHVEACRPARSRSIITLSTARRYLGIFAFPAGTRAREREREREKQREGKVSASEPSDGMPTEKVYARRNKPKPNIVGSEPARHRPMEARRQSGERGRGWGSQEAPP